MLHFLPLLFCRKKNHLTEKDIRMKQFIWFSAVMMATFCGSVFSGSVRPDYHAPIGVMADHKHEKGDWMVSCRFMLSET